MTKLRRYLIAVSVGVAITPLAAAFAIESAGGGHGHYTLAKLLFPYSMLLTRLANDTVSPALILLALAQFPLYGLAWTFVAGKRRGVVATGGVALAHLVAAASCFFGLLPNFA